MTLKKKNQEHILFKRKYNIDKKKIGLRYLIVRNRAVSLNSSMSIYV